MRILQSDGQWALDLLAFGPNGLLAATTSTFGTRPHLEMWDVTTGGHLWTHRSRGFVGSGLAFVLGGRAVFLTESSEASLLTLGQNTGDNPTEDERIGWTNAAVVAVGDRVFVGRTGSGAVGSGAAALTCWGLPELNLIWKVDRWPQYIHFSPGGAVDPTGGFVAMPLNVGGTRPELAVSVRYAGTGAERTHVRLDAAARQLAFTADGAKLLVRTDNRSVQMFDSATGTRAGELVHPRRPYVTAVAVHPRGAVACARTDGTVTFWNAEAREQIRTLDWKAGKLVSLAFAPDGALAAAGTEDGKVVVWDVDV